MPSARGQAVASGSLFVSQQQRSGAVVHARGVAGRDGTAFTNHALQLGQRFQAGFARVLVLRHDDGVALLLCDRDRHDLGVEDAFFLRASRLLLAGQREQVLVFAADLEIVCDVFGRFRHRIHAVLRLHQLVDEAPADRRVIDGGVARKRAVGLAHDERRTAHAFDAASQHQAGFTGANGAGGGADGVQARTAQAVDGGAGHFDRQTGQQRGHAGDVAVVFASLVRATHDRVIQFFPAHAGVARYQRLDGDSGQIVGAHRSQRAAVAAEGSADRITNKGIHGHEKLGVK